MRASLKREDMTDRSLHAQTGSGILDRGMRGELSFWEYDEAGFIIGGSPERSQTVLLDPATLLGAAPWTSGFLALSSAVSSSSCLTSP